MTYKTILYDVTDQIATITINRPEKMNALNGTMIKELMDAFERNDADDNVRAVVVTGAGDRAFCAGADLTPEDGKKPFASEEPVDDYSDPRVRDGGGLLTLRMYQSLKPVIGAINGAAVGVGATMLLPMDIRLASETARVGYVFARRGIAPDGAASWFLPNIVGRAQALEWCMTGRVFDAEEALRGGLVRSLHKPEELLDAAYTLAREIVDNTAPVSVAVTRQMLWQLPAEDHPMEAHKIDSRIIYRRAKSEDAKEGIASFLEKRKPEYPDKVSTDLPDAFPWWEEPIYK